MELKDSLKEHIAKLKREIEYIQVQVEGIIHEKKTEIAALEDMLAKAEKGVVESAENENDAAPAA